MTVAAAPPIKGAKLDALTFGGTNSTRSAKRGFFVALSPRGDTPHATDESPTPRRNQRVITGSSLRCWQDYACAHAPKAQTAPSRTLGKTREICGKVVFGKYKD